MNYKFAEVILECFKWWKQEKEQQCKEKKYTVSGTVVVTVDDVELQVL